MNDISSDTKPLPAEGRTELTIKDGVATVLFNRPAARNAMTWAMYEQLASACETIAADDSVRVACFRGVGGKAFVAGTDIAQFLDFESGDKGVAYEHAIGHFVGKMASLTVPTVAIVEGWAVGGGMALANVCDFRIASNGTRFGVPIARTLGNCLSSASLASLTATLGTAMVRRMVLLGEMVDAGELYNHGYLLKVVAPEELDAVADAVVTTLLGHAPITMAVTKQLMARQANGDMEDEDLVRLTYGSDDFREGVKAFTEKRPPKWTGR